MAIRTEAVEYSHQGTTLERTKAWDDSIPGPRPAVLVCHAWAGLTDFEREKACDLAELGYIGFAVDLVGKGITGGSTEENQKLIAPFVEDRTMLHSRLMTALNQVRDMPEVDETKIAVIGFCFGGLCALDLARIGAPVKGVVSFHGALGAPDTGAADSIEARILALHGWDDPMVKPDAVVKFANEMTESGADWRLTAYGSTMHAFTNPKANDPGLGTVYNEKSADLAWKAMEGFLGEVFG